MALHRYLFSIALGCAAVFASCSDDESSIRQPEPDPADAPICQIRIERGTDIRLLDFTYDEYLRVNQLIETRANGSDISTAIYRYSYPSGRIEIEQSNGYRYGIALNSEGYAVHGESSDGTVVSYTYNSNGYYYEQPSDAAWANYEYLLSGSRCNLAHITQYGAKNSIGASEKLSETSFTPGEQLNDANLNLAYLVTRDVQSATLQQGDAMLFGWVGHRDTNLPAAYTHVELRTGASVAYTFSYDTDAMGRIVRIDAEQADSEEHTIYTINYSYK